MKETGRSRSDFGILSPSVPCLFEPQVINTEEVLRMGQKIYRMLNEDQRSAANEILAAHYRQSTIFKDGPGDTEKIQLYNILCHLLKGQGIYFTTVAWTEIGANLLSEVRTA